MNAKTYRLRITKAMPFEVLLTALRRSKKRSFKDLVSLVEATYPTLPRMAVINLWNGVYFRHSSWLYVTDARGVFAVDGYSPVEVYRV